MEPFHLEPTDHTPRIDFQPSAGGPGVGSLAISGESYPENVAAFYQPVLKTLETFLASAQELQVVFAMRYFNTSSAKFFYDLFLLLEGLRERVRIDVVWRYEPEDEIMLEHGEDFQLDFNLPIRLEAGPPGLKE
jgi:hypothetical protein